MLMLCLFVLTEFTNVTDTHTQTAHDGIGRAYAYHRAEKLRIFSASLTSKLYNF